MRQILERAKLVLEAEDAVGRERAQRLEGHARPALAIPGFIHHAHAAFTEAAAHVEAPGAVEIDIGQMAHAASL